MSLFLKYRPQNFEDFIGQEHIAITIINSFKKSNISQAYLFCGPRGTGKTTLARLIAKSLNCENPLMNNLPCNKCSLCQESMEGKLIDLIEIDAASNRGIDEIRELKEKINYSPSRGKKKIYIIDEVHMLTKEAFNALLKTLEEPPNHTHFILATTESHKVPETIISRCLKFDFKRINSDDIIKRLKTIALNEKIEIEEKALQIIAKTSNGGLRDAIQLLEQLNNSGTKISAELTNKFFGYADLTEVEKLLNYLKKTDAKNALELIQSIYSKGTDLSEFCKNFIYCLREQIKINLDKTEELKLLVKIIDFFEEALGKLKNSIIPELPLESAILKTILLTKQNSSPPINANIEKLQKDRLPQPLKKEKNTELIEEIKKKWPEIINEITIPSVKISLKEGFPMNINGNDLITFFNSSFHLNKISSTENIKIIEDAINKTLPQKNLRFIAKLGDIGNNKIKKIEQPITIEKNEKKNLTEQVIDIFGGSLIEDESY